MVRKRRHGLSVQSSLPETRLSIVTPETRRPPEASLASLSDLERIGATLMFFLSTTPLILFGLALAYEVWHICQGRGLLDPWTFFTVTPFGVILAPVLFYLGWYFQGRSKGERPALENAMGGRFRAYCVTLFGFLAVVTTGLAIIGALGTAFIASDVVLISWAGTAFVAIGLISWLFRSMRGSLQVVASRPISIRPTGIALSMFSPVWLYPCAIAYRQQDWAQLRGAAIMFLLFVVPGLLAIWLSGRKRRWAERALRMRVLRDTTERH